MSPREEQKFHVVAEPYGCSRSMAGYLRKTRTQLRWTHWSYGVEVLCGFTDGEHEIRKPKHMWTDDDLEPVQMMYTETREVTTMMLEILEQENAKFKLEFEPKHQEMECNVHECQMLVYSRRLKGWRELEPQHEATVSENATDDQKLRMNREFKVVCLTDETRLLSMKYSDRHPVME